MNYFREHLKVGDYLTESGQVEMEWFGQGAARLGLNGSCELVALERLCAGRHPTTDKRLGVRDKGGARRVCYFGQISAPKDVSIALHVGGDRRIEGWWRDAVQETMREIEAVTATRRIAERCSFTLDDLGYRFPEMPLAPGETAARRLAELAWAGVHRRWGDPPSARVRGQPGERVA